MTTKQFDKVHVLRNGQACVVSGSSEFPKLGTFQLPPCGDVSASEVASGIWYLNRALVQPAEVRGRGLGTQLLNLLLDNLRQDPNFVQLTVEPGGYDEDPVRQARFYTKNGFKKDPSEYNTYHWVTENSDAIAQTTDAEASEGLPAGAPEVGGDNQPITLRNF